MRYQLIDVRPVAGGIGAEIFGPDLSEDLSEEMVAAVRSALLEHCVIFFRDQKISDDDLARFSRMVAREFRSACAAVFFSRSCYSMDSWKITCQNPD